MYLFIAYMYLYFTSIRLKSYKKNHNADIVASFLHNVKLGTINGSIVNNLYSWACVICLRYFSAVLLLYFIALQLGNE